MKITSTVHAILTWSFSMHVKLHSTTGFCSFHITIKGTHPTFLYSRHCKSELVLPWREKILEQNITLQGRNLSSVLIYPFLVSSNMLQIYHILWLVKKNIFYCLLVIFKFALYVAYMSQAKKHVRDYGYIAHIKILTLFEQARFIICELTFIALYC